jgi:hypothetical protein
VAADGEPAAVLRLSREREALLRFGPSIVAFWGWALLALAVARHGPFVIAGAVGFLAATRARAAPAVSAVFEVVALGVVVAAAPGDALGYLALGAAVVVVARALAMFARYKEAS